MCVGANRCMQNQVAMEDGHSQAFRRQIRVISNNFSSQGTAITRLNIGMQAETSQYKKYRRVPGKVRANTFTPVHDKKSSIFLQLSNFSTVPIVWNRSSILLISSVSAGDGAGHQQPKSKTHAKARIARNRWGCIQDKWWACTEKPERTSRVLDTSSTTSA